MSDAIAMEEMIETVELVNGQQGQMKVETKGGRTLVKLYDRKTGVASEALPYMVQGMLAMKDPETGERRFSAKQEVEPHVGTFICYLNPKHPEHKETLEAGVTGVTCRRDNLQSAFDLQEHMRGVHPKESKTINDFRARREADEQREFQRLQTELLKQQLNGGTKSGTR